MVYIVMRERILHYFSVDYITCWPISSIPYNVVFEPGSLQLLLIYIRRALCERFLVLVIGLDTSSG
jgi:hypothetical protein